MRVLVVGGTGRTGRAIVEAARKAGHAVRVLARSAAEQVWPDGVEALGGDVLDPRVVDRAMAGVDGVIVAISMVRTSNFPWARITTPLDLHRRAAEILTAAALSHGVKSYVTISAHGVGESASRAGTLFLALVRSSNIGVAYADLARAEAIVRGSGVPWTIVRPTRLTDDAPTGRWSEGPHLVTTSFDRVPRADLAAFLVAEVERGAWRGAAVTLTAASG